MTDEPDPSWTAFLDWLGRADHPPIVGWEPEPPFAELHCHPDLIARLAEVARPIRSAGRVFVGGQPVIHHPRGRPIAAASGMSWLAVRSDLAAGGLAQPPPPTPGLGPDWLELNPFAADVAFAKATDLLRAHVKRAYELAETEIEAGASSLGWVPWNVAVEAGAVVGTVGVAARVSRKRWLERIAPFTIELAIVLVLYALWRVVGTISVLKVNHAIAAGQHIWDFERAIHLPNERGLQHLFLKSSALIQACNLFYASVHIPSMGIFLVWLWFRHRDHYPTVRNVVALTTLWCLAIQLIPVAPPRLVPALHVADTPALFGQAVYPAFGKSGPAQLSAMPSVHVAWAAIIGVTIVVASTSRWRWIFLAHPFVTMIVVVVTGNHYWLDGVVGVMIAALAFVFERRVRAFVTRRRRADRTPARATAQSFHGSSV